MKIFYLLLTILIALGYSCSKEDLSPNKSLNTSVEPKDINQSTPTAATIYNPIVGRWELGAFKILCPGAKDTTIYPNERGDFVEFRKTDTAFYTYNTTNATGWSPYKILDSSRFILGDTMRIISNDGVRLTTYTKSSNGGSQQWMTYKKVAN
ncbi:MAG: hypothetical protein JSR09_09650 [Bacteroidetes bacterium]|nr:hypothetical protein [Bacteroidota bacterium]